MPIADDDVSMIVEGIFADLLGFEVRRRDPAEGGWEGPMLVGSVDISGAWEGTVTVDCPTELAEQTARAMFGGELSGSGDVRDAVGEVANIAGGNIKGLLPTPSHLSLPAVASSTGPTVAPASALVTEVAFDCQGLPLFVTVLRRAAAASES
ncbi:MAG TPA: chemotaxis protein CheX [Actinomycetes bacterium]|jgi:chemotaxis protein CheX|nr:chemotaxis protein CheX [Actinomycetes bacterium]